uniref:Nucleoside-diphosphate sugar epimerase n=1 Tax=Glossina morsitans morsitans TaxID=37546 RepID=A0A1B0FHI3_GLOMM
MGKHTLIGGGTGFIGSHLAKHLLEQDYQVTRVSRMPGRKSITWHKLQKNGLPSGVTSVVNLAGENVLNPFHPWTEGFKQNVWNSRINTSANMVKAIQKSNDVEVYINIIGVSHYKPDDLKIYSEQDKVEGYDFLSNLCLEWEKAATLPEDTAKNTREIKLRTGLVIGRGGGMIRAIWRPFMMGLGGPLGSGKQILPWIHLEDLCRLIQYCIENKKIKGPVNAVAPEIITNEEFSKTFASTFNRPCVFNMGEAMIKFLYGDERSPLLLSGAKIHPDKVSSTGFQFQYPTVKAACMQMVEKE